jgi:hypothetical protein
MEFFIAIGIGSAIGGSIGLTFVTLQNMKADQLRIRLDMKYNADPRDLEVMENELVAVSKLSHFWYRLTGQDRKVSMLFARVYKYIKRKEF